MRELVWKKVEVISADTVYRGTLIEIGETEVYLLSESGWIVIPVNRIAEIKAVE
jgi:hypothetical protein